VEHIKKMYKYKPIKQTVILLLTSVFSFHYLNYDLGMSYNAFKNSLDEINYENIITNAFLIKIHKLNSI
jgi:hypothetical protein